MGVSSVVGRRPASRVELAASGISRNRRDSRELFDLLDPAVYYARPIALRNPDRVLRGASAGIQHHCVPASRSRRAARRRAAREAVRARHRSGERRGRRAAHGPSTVWPRRDEVLAFAAAVDDAVREALAHAEFDEAVRRCGAGEGAVHRARARSDAPGDAALHVASPAARPEESSAEPPLRVRRRSAATPRRCRSLRAPRRSARGESASRSAGTTSSTSIASTCRPSRLMRTASPTPTSSSSSRPVAIESRELWSDEGWAWREGRRGASRFLGSPTSRRHERAVGTGE